MRAGRIESAPLAPISSAAKPASNATASSVLAASTATAKQSSPSSAADTSGGLLSKLFNGAKSALTLATTLYSDSEKKGGVVAVAVDTLGGLPNASKIVVGNVVVDAQKAGLGQVAVGYNSARTAKDPLTLIEGSAAMAAGAIGVASAPFAPMFSPVSKTVSYVGDKTSDFPAVQRFANSTPGTLTSRFFEDVSNLTTIVGAVAGGPKGTEIGPAISLARGSEAVVAEKGATVRVVPAPENLSATGVSKGGPVTTSSSTGVEPKDVISTAPAGVLRPSVSDAKLNNIVRNLYKGTNTPNRIGTGSTADAIRNELKTDEPTGTKYRTFHVEKGIDSIRALDKWLVAHPNAIATDREAAIKMRNDLLSALSD